MTYDLFFLFFFFVSRSDISSSQLDFFKMLDEKIENVSYIFVCSSRLVMCRVCALNENR